MTKRNFYFMNILVLALMFMAVFSPRADARSTYLTSCMTAASNATGCHPSAAGIAGKAPTLTTTDCKSCHHHGLATIPVVTTDKTTYTSTENILFKFTGGNQSGRAGLVVYNLAGTAEVARGVIMENNTATLSVPASAFGAITNTAIKTAWRGNAINTTNGTSNVCTTSVPCTAHEFSAVINTPAITITGGAATGTLTGTVTNASGGAAIAGATVTANGVNATTNASGVYTMTVSAGTFTATASATGFNSSSASVTVTANGTTTRNFALTAATTCTRAAPTVTFSPTSGTVTPGGTAAYTVTVRNMDTTPCSSSTFALTVSAETGTALNFVVPSTLSPTSCSSLAPGGTCTSTLTVKAQSAAKSGATDATTVRAADSTNHNTLPGTGSVTTTVAAAAGTYTLTVASLNPSSGVTVTVSPNDTTGKGKGTTQFTRTYTSGTVVTLTAPGSSPTTGYGFLNWQMNGKDFVFSTKVTTTITANTTMTAVYTSTVASQYTVVASNDLGMHCVCPSYDKFSLLPPFNTVRVQVLKKGGDSVTSVSSGITVNYSIKEETDSTLINDPYFANWIAYSPKIFPGFKPVVNGKVMGIAGYGLSGTMKYNSQAMAWEAVGIPAYPVVTGNPALDVMPDPLGGPNRDPYLTAQITAKDSTGKVLGTTTTVVPVSLGGCCSCHIPLAQEMGYPPTTEGSWAALGKMHGLNSSKVDVAYLDPDGDGVSGPVRCSWCHWDPAMGESAAPGIAAVWPNYKILPGATFTKAQVVVSSRSYSDVIHKFHAQDQKVLTQYDPNINTNCYDCHPEPTSVVCYRGVHKSKNVWCTDCHGNLNQRIATGQLAQPWKTSTLPSCSKPAKGITSGLACHSAVPQTTWDPGLFGSYINGRGGMESHKILCESCHGSAHAENPSTAPPDNTQNAAIHTALGTTFPAGKDKTYAIGSCRICHTNESNMWSPRVMYGE